MAWRELVCVTARYYKAGEQPWPDYMTERLLAENVSEDWENHPDEWWAERDLWWFPGVGEYRKGEGDEYARQREIPDVDTNHRLLTDAVHFERVAPARAGLVALDSHPGGLIQYNVEQICVREALIGCADDMKALCDLVRGADNSPWVEALIVFECEAGRDYWGEYFSDFQPIGLLELDKAPIRAA